MKNILCLIGLHKKIESLNPKGLSNKEVQSYMIHCGRCNQSFGSGIKFIKPIIIPPKDEASIGIAIKKTEGLEENYRSFWSKKLNKK